MKPRPIDPNIEEFFRSVRANVEGLKRDDTMHDMTRAWLENVAKHRYAYNFTWMGRPALQFPQDMIAVQELVWATQPDVIIETGVAHGGALVYYASLFEMMQRPGRVFGIDIEIRAHNRSELERHPMWPRIQLFEGSSTDPAIVERVRTELRPNDRVMVLLDSNHTHDHVLAELEAYGPLIAEGCYLVVFDTLIEFMPKGSWPDRPWDVGNNPKTAVDAYLRTHPEFEVDDDIDSKLLITAAPGGFLRRRERKPAPGNTPSAS